MRTNANDDFEQPGPPAAEQEHRGHPDVLDDMAEEFHEAPRRVAEIYARHRRKLAQGARVRDYLDALATRHTRASLRRHSLQK